MKEPLIYLNYLLLSVIKRWPKNPENENKNIICFLVKEKR